MSVDMKDWDWQVGDYAYLNRDYEYLSKGSVVKVTSVGSNGGPYTGNNEHKFYIQYAEPLRAVRPNEVVPANAKIGCLRTDGELNTYARDSEFSWAASAPGMWYFLAPPYTGDELRIDEAMKRIEAAEAELAAAKKMLG